MKTMRVAVRETYIQTYKISLPNDATHQAAIDAVHEKLNKGELEADPDLRVFLEYQSKDLSAVEYVEDED